jgi:hypothetical protein
MSFYGEIGSCTPDNLIAGENVPINVKGVTLATGQGTLARGTVLGKSPVDDKFYKVDSAAAPVVKRTLQITGETTKTAVLALAGLTANSLKVFVGDEHGALAEAGAAKDYTAAYANDTLTITIVANGKLDGVAQCYIEIDKAAAGANEADCILTDAVDTGTTADVVSTAYTSGMFNRQALAVADDDNIANHEDALRSKGIFLKDTISY